MLQAGDEGWDESLRSGARVLIADDEPNLRRVLVAQLRRHGYRARAVSDGQEALNLLQEEDFDVVISDMRMPVLDGMTLLKRLVQDRPELPVIMITAHGTVDTAVEALKLGAFDYVTKPFDRDELRSVVDKAARSRELNKSEASAALVVKEGSALKGRFGLIGMSRAIEGIFDIIDRVAATPSTVLITGESGTGKELVARALHTQSLRKDAPFIRLNVAAIPSELIESELFGYEKGAFTGAVGSKPGRFELADGGTLFLDEIGEIPVNTQVKLLRAIQEQEFERVGGVRTTRVDVRLVTATNRDLKREVEEGRFRADLYYRLNVVQLRLPPLRERKEDIPLLVDHFVAHFNQRLQKSVEGVSPAALALLEQFAWEGNIRELENVIERCLLFCDEREILPQHLPAELLPAQRSSELTGLTGQALTGQALTGQAPTGQACAHDAPADATREEYLLDGGLKDAVKDATAKLKKRELIIRALEETEGNVTHAAKLLKISRKSLQTKMKELGLRES